MEENKYYTPGIDELYIGFECEFFNNMQGKEWEKEVCDADTLSIAFDIHEHGTIEWDDDFSRTFRVKHLDKQDLIELGFEYMEDVRDCINFAKYIQESNQSINLTLHRNSRRVGVAVHDLNVKPPMTSIQIGTFGGEIKNKSELIKVLKMLGIK